VSNSFETHRQDLREIAYRAKKVGGICLLPSASFDDYVLAGIRVLNEHLNGPAHRLIAEKTFLDVVHYKYWSTTDSNGKKIPIIPQNIGIQDFHQIFENTIVSLDSFDLIEISPKGYSISYLGKTALESFKIEESTSCLAKPIIR